MPTPGETAYTAYADERAKTDYRPVDWTDLGSVRQAAWEAAAQAVLGIESKKPAHAALLKGIADIAYKRKP